jgi:hypothetical protein
MAEIASFERFLWAIMMLLAGGLAGVVLYRKNYRVYPLFFAYILAILVQNLVIALSYRLWGFSSAVSFRIRWGTQSVVIVARALAVVEICRRILSKYSGIWALGWRIFFSMATVVLVYSWAVVRHSWQLVAVTADRSLELAMATAILALFLFVRYYQVVVEPAARLLATGFFLYCCFRVLDDTILERWLTHYAMLWNSVGTLSFVGSLLLWTWAMRRTASETTFEPELLSENHYRSLAPEINVRLKTLNEQLSHFWRVEGNRT